MKEEDSNFFDGRSEESQEIEFEILLVGTMDFKKIKNQVLLKYLLSNQGRLKFLLKIWWSYFILFNYQNATTYTRV